MELLGANRVQTKKEENLRRSADYRKVDNAIFRARRKLRGNQDRQARRELLATLEKLEKEMRHTPRYETRHQTKLGYVRYADDFVILVNGTKEEAIDHKNKVEGHLAAMGLTLSVEKTSITHWEKPIRFLGYDIHGRQRAKGVQITAVLSIPKEKERAIRRELVRVASYHHIPEIDAMMSMNAKFRGWCNYYKYANNPHLVFNGVARKMWWFYAHFLARKQRSSMRALLTRANTNGSYRMITKGTSK
jgi:RNA-directed DNA polymerase